MNKNLALAAVLFAAVAATGCANRGAKKLPPPPVDGSADAGNNSNSAAIAEPVVANPIAPPPAASTSGAYDLSSKLVYFGYDSADIDTAGQGVISNYSRYLTGSSSAKVRLEGHTDERGSTEYNIALGERRAQTVARELKATGVTDAQLVIISYGEERPQVPGSSEEAYAKNRRVEITQP